MTSGHDIAKILHAHCICKISLGIRYINSFYHRTAWRENSVIIPIDCLLFDKCHEVRENLIDNLLIFVLLEIVIKQFTFEMVRCQIRPKIRINSLQYIKKFCSPEVLTVSIQQLENKLLFLKGIPGRPCGWRCSSHNPTKKQA